MRLRKISIIIFMAFFIFVGLSFSACKKTKLTILKPGSEKFNLLDGFSKVKDGTFAGKDGSSMIVENDGQDISIKGSDGKEIHYKKTETIVENGKINIYKKSDTNSSSTTTDKENLIVLGTTTIEVSDNGTEAVKKAIKLFGEDKSISMVLDSQNTEYQTSSGDIDTNKLVEKYKLTEYQRVEFEKLFRNIKKEDFGDPKGYK